jgi:hypothetical protein
MDRFLQLIVQGDISSRTKEMLLKQMNEQLVVPPPPVAAAGQMSGQRSAEMVPSMAGDPTGANPIQAQLQLPGPQPARQQQLARASAAEINNPVVKIVGLILGSPEFQRQ